MVPALCAPPSFLGQVKINGFMTVILKVEQISVINNTQCSKVYASQLISLQH